jgi:ADP-ribosylglycohydrolase
MIRTTQPNCTLARLLLGLASGDALGSTSEFFGFDQVQRLLEGDEHAGWPFRQVGGGRLGWRVGEPTDDTEMAAALVESFLGSGGFDPIDLGRRWIEWMDSKPPDIGATTRDILRAIKRGAAWNQAGRDLYRERPQALANGSLMRNGVVRGLCSKIDEAWDLSLRHGMITHYAPLPVLCCAAQTWLIDGLLRNTSPFDHGWTERFIDAWRLWIEAAATPWTQAWLSETWPHLDEAIEQVRDADFDPDRFDPFQLDLTETAGYCLTTLQIAVWATRWAVRGDQIPLPPWVPTHVRERARGSYSLAAVALIGHDSDTYAATAGPMIAAATGQVPAEFTEGLEINSRTQLWETVRGS